MLEMLRTPIGRGVAAIAATLLLFVLVIWLAPDAAPVFPAVLVIPIWLAFFPSKQQVSPASRRLMLVLLGAGIATFLLGVLAYITY